MAAAARARYDGYATRIRHTDRPHRDDGAEEDGARGADQGDDRGGTEGARIHRGRHDPAGETPRRARAVLRLRYFDRQTGTGSVPPCTEIGRTTSTGWTATRTGHTKPTGGPCCGWPRSSKRAGKTMETTDGQPTDDRTEPGRQTAADRRTNRRTTGERRPSSG